MQHSVHRLPGVLGADRSFNFFLWEISNVGTRGDSSNGLYTEKVAVRADLPLHSAR